MDAVSRRLTGSRSFSPSDVLLMLTRFIFCRYQRGNRGWNSKNGITPKMSFASLPFTSSFSPSAFEETLRSFYPLCREFETMRYTEPFPHQDVSERKLAYIYMQPTTKRNVACSINIIFSDLTLNTLNISSRKVTQHIFKTKLPGRSHSASPLPFLNCW